MNIQYIMSLNNKKELLARLDKIDAELQQVKKEVDERFTDMKNISSTINKPQ